MEWSPKSVNESAEAAVTDKLFACLTETNTGPPVKETASLEYESKNLVAAPAFQYIRLRV